MKICLQQGWRETRKTVAGGKGKNTRNDRSVGGGWVVSKGGQKVK